jgi:hypothetical protein
MSTPAPIVVFAYNRTDHLSRTLAALAANELALGTEVTIFCDGPKSSEAREAVEATRAVARSARGFKSLRTVERDANMGLANSVIAGVTEICGAHGRVIVVEDDLVTAPTFLRFMNDALDRYEHDSRVGSIHGYWYPVDKPVPETFFLRGASCWGWATWSRGWQVFERDGAKLLNELRSRGLTRAFDLDGAMAYTKMLEAQIAGRNNSWAIRWHASTFLAGLLQLSPGRSLVRNIGFDGSGTHCDDSGAFDVSPVGAPVQLRDIPVEQSEVARAALIHYYNTTRRSFPQRAAGKLRRVLKGWFG